MSAVRGAWLALARAAQGEASCTPMPPGLSPSEACAFVRSHCAGSSTYAYLNAYYCLGSSATFTVGGPMLVSFALFVWLLLLFSALGLVASDFFCPNLTTIAKRLGLSDSIVGVTLLALGNGFPDVISTFRAMEKDAGALALGELMGAAVFTVSMVCGSIMLFHEFTVPAASFLRDVGTYTIAVVLVLFFLLDGTLGLGEGACMLGLYLGYVATVCIGDLSRPTTDEESTLLLDSAEESPSTPQIGHHSLLSAARVHDLARLADTGFIVSDDMAHHMLQPSFALRHPPLYRTFSQHSLERSRCRSPVRPLRPSRARTLDTVRSPRMVDALYTPPPARQGSASFRRDAPSPPREPTPSTTQNAMEDVFARLQAPPESHSLSRLLLIAFLPSLLSWEQNSRFHRGVSVFCAPAYLALRLTVPLVSFDEFLLHQALGRLRDAADAEDAQALWTEVWDEVGAVLETPAPIVHTAERVAADHLLLSMHCVMAPLFLLWVVEAPWVAWATATVLGSCAGAALWRHVRSTAERDAPAQLQLYALPRSMLGFVMGLVWIVVLVDNVLALLRAMGYLYHWSEAILGLTLFALGNSLGDVVTNLSIVRLGHPTMALTACFASPMTNLLLGIGFSATWLTLRHPTQGPYHIALSPALVLSSSVLLFMLIMMLVILPIMRFRVNKYLGMCLLTAYMGAMAANLLLELHSDARLV
ncbi:hypothetical protein MNAN1_003178 [Malassezia nana]|uniref:Sodium/calcium exchanger membrane region domain-containing protein n=1 Tax=Malassezia nana TaxID=180528 RepID=A0AAF0ETM2_9BASI|nr:hypothetical protein MNAN1_003178 [Malassezia nana]